MLAGSIALSKLNSTGTADNTTFLRGDGAWTATSTLSLADGDKGDITVSSSGAAWAIDSSYVGSSAITTLGTIATGTWSGTAIGPTKGGMGLATIAQGALLYPRPDAQRALYI